MLLSNLLSGLLFTTAGFAQGTEGTRLNLEATVSGDSKIETVTNQLVEKEIELARLTTLFRRNNVRETKLHKWLTVGFNTAAYATADAGNIVTFINGYKYHTRPQDLNLGTGESGPLLIFLGELLFFTKTCTLSGLDIWHHYQIKSRGFDRKTFESRAAQLQTAIHALLTQRQQLVNANGVGAYAQEQAVLQDISDGLFKEFVYNYGRSKKIQAFHATENTITSYTSATGAWIGGLGIFEAAQHVRPRTAAVGGIGFIFSGLGFITKDCGSRWMSLRAQKKAKAELLARHGEAAADPVSKLSSDILPLGAVGVSSIQKRQKIYETMHTVLTKDQLLSQTEEREEYHRFLHDQTINTAEGLANIAAGTILVNSGYRFNYSQNPLVQIDHGRKFLRRFATSALVFTPTASAGIFDTPAEAIYGEWRHKKDCEKGACPEVALTDRLTLLDQAESAIKQ